MGFFNKWGQVNSQNKHLLIRQSKKNTILQKKKFCFIEEEAQTCDHVCKLSSYIHSTANEAVYLALEMV